MGGGGSGSAGKAGGGVAGLACCVCLWVACVGPACVLGRGEQKRKLRETGSLGD